jgi:hypothetical protein
MKTSTVIDTFVETINRSSDILYPLDEEELPTYLRIGGPNEDGQYGWKICPQESMRWRNPVIQSLPVRFPPSYFALVSRYAFAAIELPSVMLLANTGEPLR